MNPRIEPTSNEGLSIQPDQALVARFSVQEVGRADAAHRGRQLRVACFVSRSRVPKRIDLICEFTYFRCHAGAAGIRCAPVDGTPPSGGGALEGIHKWFETELESVLQGKPDELAVKVLQHNLGLRKRGPVHNDYAVPYFGWERVRQMVAFADWKVTEPATPLSGLTDVEKTPLQPDAVNNWSLEPRPIATRPSELTPQPVGEFESAFAPESRGISGLRQGVEAVQPATVGQTMKPLRM